MEFDVHNSLCMSGGHVALSDEREVFRLAKEAEHCEIPFEEHREAIELVPLVDTGNIGSWRSHAMSFAQVEQRRCIDGAFEMYVEFGFGNRTNGLAWKRSSHPGHLCTGVLASAAMEYPTQVLHLDRQQWVKVANIAIKVALAIAFFIAIVIQPPGAVGKGMEFRAPGFLGSAILVPVIAKLRKWDPYPHTADALLAAPFLLDTVANVSGFYESFGATDDVLHITNWILLTGAFAAFRFRNVHHRKDALLLGYGFGGLAIIWWEIFEWTISSEGPLLGGDGLGLGYTDTIGDLFLSSTGGLIGAFISIKVLGPLLSDPEPAV